jgi:uncharacterized protein (TIGR02466 family)
MSNNRSDWFPTSVWHFDIENHTSLNQKLLKAIYAEKQRDNQGVLMSNAGGWHSVEDFQVRPEFKDFVNLVSANALQVAQEINWDLQKVRLSVNSCWGMVNGKFASNYVHNHPNSILSGVYYVQAPENSGGIFFRDPRESAHIFLPPVAEISPWTLQKVTYKPTEGRMLIFPSWLMHGVEPNLSDRDRVSISFNIGMLANT